MNKAPLMVRARPAFNSHVVTSTGRQSIYPSSADATSEPDPVEFLIVHDFADNPEGCMPGEEAALVAMGIRGNWHWVPFGPTHVVTFDFLCKRRIPLDAWSIANKMASDPFILQHGTNAPCHLPRPARLSPAGVRQHIRRMRTALAAVIEQTRLDIDPWTIICSVSSSTCSKRYFVNAKVSWRHWCGAEGEDSGTCILFSPQPHMVLRSPQSAR